VARLAVGHCLGCGVGGTPGVLVVLKMAADAVRPEPRILPPLLVDVTRGAIGQGVRAEQRKTGLLMFQEALGRGPPAGVVAAIAGVPNLSPVNVAVTRRAPALHCAEIRSPVARLAGQAAVLSGQGEARLPVVEGDLLLQVPPRGGRVTRLAAEVEGPVGRG